jgi:hypothetical protein
MKLAFAILVFVMAKITTKTIASPINGSSLSQEDFHAFVRRKTRSLTGYYTDTLVDSMETAYNEYAQAWRMLGFYIDCGDDAVMWNRRLDEANANDNGEEEDVAAEEEENVGDDAVNNNNNNNNNNNAAQGGCYRYLLWAAVSMAIKLQMLLHSAFRKESDIGHRL